MIGTGSSTGTVTGGLVDGTPSWRSVVVVCAVGFGTPILSALYGPPWMLPAETVPAGVTVTALIGAGLVARRAVRAEHRRVGFGVDPDASRPDHPFAVTAVPGREDALLLDGLAWSAAGCPMPDRPVHHCTYGHVAHVPAGGLALPFLLLFGRRRWQCSYGHPAATPAVTEMVPAGDLAAEPAADPHTLPPMPLPVEEPVGVAS